MGARVEGVDDHLPIDGAGDFDSAILKIGRDGGDLPIGVADGLGLREEAGQFAGLEARIASVTSGEALLPRRLELVG